MSIVELHIQNFRNICGSKIELSDRLNVITGVNGSGKTTLLEAIHFLGRGRSFRTHAPGDIIGKHGNEAYVFATLSWSGNQFARLGIAIDRNAEKLKIQLDGKSIQRSSDLASLVPLVFAGPDVGSPLFGSPSDRRRVLDWGVFHVEHWARASLERFKRLLSQRNALIRRTNPSSSLRSELSAWDLELSRYATDLDQARQRFLARIEPLFQHFLGLLSPSFCAYVPLTSTIRFHYSRGWAEGESLHSILQQQFDSDLARGHTSRGPHRADLSLVQDEVMISSRCSHGQQKILSAALALAQIALLKEITGNQCIFLVDDLASELDVTHRSQFLTLLSELAVQTLMTATELTLFEKDSIRPQGLNEARVFHVKHGEISSHKN